jgi:hypothetical protein
MFEHVDIYCERTAVGLFNEPLNAVTNFAFFIAAWLVLRSARRSGRLDWALTVLIGLVFAIGLGSLLWHTFAQRWAGAADVIPILLFIVTYVGLTMWRYFGARAGEAIALAIAFLFFAPGLRSAAAATLPTVLSPAFGYLPAFVALVVCGVLLALRRHPVAWWLLGAGTLFLVSLTFRGLDSHVCGDFAFGTHFLWHILNATVLGTLMIAYMRHGVRRPAKAVT